MTSEQHGFIHNPSHKKRSRRLRTNSANENQHGLDETKLFQEIFSFFDLFSHRFIYGQRRVLIRMYFQVFYDLFVKILQIGSFRNHHKILINCFDSVSETTSIK